MSIGEKIRDLRKSKNMTQEDLAECLNVTISAVSQWEIGKTMPDITMIPIICNVFDVFAFASVNTQVRISVFCCKPYGIAATRKFLDSLHKLNGILNICVVMVSQSYVYHCLYLQKINLFQYF